MAAGSEHRPALVCREGSGPAPCRREGTHIATCAGLGSSIVCDQCAKFYRDTREIRWVKADGPYIIGNLVDQLEDRQAYDGTLPDPAEIATMVYCTIAFLEDEKPAAVEPAAIPRRGLRAKHSRGQKPSRPSTRRAIPASVRFAVLKASRFACTACGLGPPDGVKLQVDHIHPVARGGTDDRDNLQALCFDCNIGKGARV